MSEFAKKHVNMEQFHLIIPIPLYSAKLRQRGFNQARLLADILAKDFKVPLLTRGLSRIKFTTSQTNLSKYERLNNVKNAFAVKEASFIRKKIILLVDDVFTTGATVSECAKMLLKAGANKVEILSLARGL
jgi:ComF family protein